MIKKITLASVATLALLILPAQIQASNSHPTEHKSSHKKMKKRHSSPLLMKLPSPMKTIMKHLEDPKLALTSKQKMKLDAQRKELMPKMMKLKKSIKATSKEIKEACRKDVPVAKQKANIEKLAAFKAEATTLKLTCIEGVKAVLSKEQKIYIKKLKKLKKDMRRKIKGMKKEASKAMKCQAGKCGTK